MKKLLALVIFAASCGPAPAPPACDPVPFVAICRQINAALCDNGEVVGCSVHTMSLGQPVTLTCVPAADCD